MENNSVLRKSGFGGFKKQDVIDYIAQINHASNLKETDLNAQISQLAKEREELRASLDQKVMAFEQLQKNINENEEAINSLSKTIEQLETVIKQKQQEVDENAAEMTAMAKNYNDYQEKALKYDEISNRLSDTLLDARRSAEKMTNEARQTADETIESAKKEAERITSAATNEAETILKQAQDEVTRVETQKDALIKDLLSRIAAYQKITTSAQESIQKFSDSIQKEMQSAKSLLSGIDEKINGFTFEGPSEIAVPAGKEDPVLDNPFALPNVEKPKNEFFRFQL